QRYLDLFQPIASELKSRGWSVPVLSYNALERPGGAVAFGDLTTAVGTLHGGTLRPPEWTITDDVLRASPVSRAWLRVVLSASWMTATIQRRRHARVLASLRPDVVISYGPETMSLALQSAARSAGIPSVLLAHGFEGPSHASFFFPATACAFPGPPCPHVHPPDPYHLPPPHPR